MVVFHTDYRFILLQQIQPLQHLKLQQSHQ